MCFEIQSEMINRPFVSIIYTRQCVVQELRISWTFEAHKHECFPSFLPFQEALRGSTFILTMYYVQGGSNMTGTDLYVNKPHCAAAVRN